MRFDDLAFDADRHVAHRNPSPEASSAASAIRFSPKQQGTSMCSTVMLLMPECLKISRQFLDVGRRVVELRAADDHRPASEESRMEVRHRERHAVRRQEQVRALQERRARRDQLELHRPVAQFRLGRQRPCFRAAGGAREVSTRAWRFPGRRAEPARCGAGE